MMRTKISLKFWNEIIVNRMTKMQGFGKLFDTAAVTTICTFQLTEKGVLLQNSFTKSTTFLESKYLKINNAKCSDTSLYFDEFRKK